MHLARVLLHAESERNLDKPNLSELELDINLKFGQVADMSTDWLVDLRWSRRGERTCAQWNGVSPGGTRRAGPVSRRPRTWRKSHTKLAAAAARVSRRT